LHAPSPSSLRPWQHSEDHALAVKEATTLSPASIKGCVFKND
jgi:hypothetical protein